MIELTQNGATHLATVLMKKQGGMVGAFASNAPQYIQILWDEGVRFGVAEDSPIGHAIQLQRQQQQAQTGGCST